MCLEDIQIGRRSVVIQRSVVVGGTSSLLVPGNPRRLSLIISCPIANRVTLSSGEAAVDQVGMVLPALGAPLQLELITHGQLLTKPIFAIASAGSNIIGIWETLLDWDDTRGVES